MTILPKFEFDVSVKEQNIQTPIEGGKFIPKTVLVV